MDDVTANGAAAGEGKGGQKGRDRLVGQGGGIRAGADEHLPRERI